MSDQERAKIRRVIEEWGIFRDSGDWVPFAGLFHPDGVIRVAWYDGHHGEFIELSRASAGKSFSKHIICNSAIAVGGSRSVAETNVILLGRGDVQGVTCHGETHMRFLDRFERSQSGSWHLLDRSSTYDQDLLSPMWPGDKVDLDLSAAREWPVEYCFLAMRLSARGLRVLGGLPTKGSEEERQVRLRNASWLEGA